jgi:hypothetical protein
VTSSQKKFHKSFEVEFECAECLPALPKTCKMHFVLILVIFAFQSVKGGVGICRGTRGRGEGEGQLSLKQIFFFFFVGFDRPKSPPEYLFNY